MMKVDSRMENFRAKFEVLDSLRDKPVRPDTSRARLYQRGGDQQSRAAAGHQVGKGRNSVSPLKVVGLPKVKKILGKDMD